MEYSTFKERFNRWKNGESYWDIIGNSLTGYKGGKDSISQFVSTFRPMLYNALQKKGYHTKSADNMLTQIAWESNYGKSNNARTNNNYGGIKNGNAYAKYKDQQDFVNHYIDLIHDRYPNAFNSTNLTNYAKELKKNGYYEDSLQHYSNSLNSMTSLRKAINAERINNQDKYNTQVTYNQVMSEPQDNTRIYKQKIIDPIPQYKPVAQPVKQTYPNYIQQVNQLPNIMDAYLNVINGRTPLQIPGQ